MATAVARTAPFKVGKKLLFLPGFTVALLRNPQEDPKIARFKVPLWFSKLDIRDYLWHVYGVEIISARSYVKQRPVQQGKKGLIRPAVKRWFRPRSLKFMTVELVQPFVWPEDISDDVSFGKQENEDRDKEQADYMKFMSSTGDAEPKKAHAEKMREQAKAILSGKVKWQPSTSSVAKSRNDM